MIFITSCASPIHNYKTEKVCQEIVELTKERMYLKIAKTNLVKQNEPDSIKINSDIIRINQKIDKNSLECKEMREEAGFSFLDFMYLFAFASNPD